MIVTPTLWRGSCCSLVCLNREHMLHRPANEQLLPEHSHGSCANVCLSYSLLVLVLVSSRRPVLRPEARRPEARLQQQLQGREEGCVAAQALPGHPEPATALVGLQVDWLLRHRHRQSQFAALASWLPADILACAVSSSRHSMKMVTLRARQASA